MVSYVILQKYSEFIIYFLFFSWPQPAVTSWVGDVSYSGTVISVMWVDQSRTQAMAYTKVLSIDWCQVVRSFEWIGPSESAQRPVECTKYKHTHKKSNTQTVGLVIREEKQPPWRFYQHVSKSDLIYGANHRIAVWIVVKDFLYFKCCILLMMVYDRESAYTAFFLWLCLSKEIHLWCLLGCGTLDVSTYIRP